MAKSKAQQNESQGQTALAEQNHQPPALPTDMPRPGRVEGGDATDLQIPILHLFQDIGNESDQYGDHDKGAWVDSLTQEAVPEPVVVPVHAYKEFVVWYDRNSNAGDGIVDRFDSKAEVPQEFIENDQDYNVVETMNWYVVLNDNPLPYLIRFKSTSLKAGRQLNTLERSREAQNKTLGAYKLGARLKTNDKGKWYDPTITPAGDASPEQVETAVSAYRMIKGGNVKVHDVDEREPGADAEDDCPI